MTDLSRILKSPAGIPILGKPTPKNRHAMFALAGACPVCQFPIFIHAELGDGMQGPIRTPFSFCQHEGMEVSLSVPLEDDPEAEREALGWLFSLVYKQQDALGNAMQAAMTWERLAEEGEAKLQAISIAEVSR